MTRQLAEQAVIVIVVVLWLGTALTLAFSASGRAYLRSSEPAAAMRLNLARQADTLVVAGLVLAALALEPAKTGNSAVADLLGTSFAAFVGAWVVAFLPGATTATVASDGLVWVGVATMLGGVFEISAAFQPQASTAQIAVLLTTGLALCMSALVARAHLRAASVEGGAPAAETSGERAGTAAE